MKKCFAFLVATALLLLTYLSAHAQDKRAIDSLMRVYNTAKHDTTKILALLKIAARYGLNKVDTAMQIAQNAFERSKKSSFLKGQGISYHIMGVIYSNQGNYIVSLDYFQKSLQINEKVHYKKEMANNFLGIGEVYHAQKDYTLAITYLKKAIKTNEDIKNTSGTSASLNTLGLVYFEQGMYDLALEYQQKSLEMAQKIKYNTGISYNLNNIADIYLKKDKVVLALEYYQKSLVMKEANEDKWGVIYSLRGIAQVYQKQQKYADAISYAERALRIAQDIKALKEINKTSLILYQICKTTQAYRQALEYHEMFKTTQDSLTNAEKVKSLANLESKYTYEKKEMALKQAQQMKDLAHEKKLASQKNYLYLTLLGVLGLGIVIVIVLRNNRLKNRLNQQLLQSQEEIQDKNRALQQAFSEIQTFNEEITQQQEELRTLNENLSFSNKELTHTTKQIQTSIRVAKTIQHAILPYKAKIDELLEEYFILYRPKDIVSGDFYWLNKIEDKIYLISADCTGHGVPGAFMTLIGCNLLDKIVQVWKISNPAEILEVLHKEVQTVLQQKETGNDHGMDITVLQWQKIDEGTQVTFAAAKQSIYYHTPKSQEIVEIKGVRKSIGGEQNIQKEFVNHTLVLPPNSTFYMGSDGLEDQNDKNRRRFGNDKIKETLAQVVNASLAEQQKGVEEALDAHMLGTEQRDDILFIGVKLQ